MNSIAGWLCLAPWLITTCLALAVGLVMFVAERLTKEQMHKEWGRFASAICLLYGIAMVLAMVLYFVGRWVIANKA